MRPSIWEKFKILVPRPTKVIILMDALRNIFTLKFQLAPAMRSPRMHRTPKITRKVSHTTPNNVCHQFDDENSRARVQLNTTRSHIELTSAHNFQSSRCAKRGDEWKMSEKFYFTFLLLLEVNELLGILVGHHRADCESHRSSVLDLNLK